MTDKKDGLYKVLIPSAGTSTDGGPRGASSVSHSREPMDPKRFSVTASTKRIGISDKDKKAEEEKAKPKYRYMGPGAKLGKLKTASEKNQIKKETADELEERISSTLRPKNKEVKTHLNTHKPSKRSQFGEINTAVKDEKKGLHGRDYAKEYRKKQLERKKLEAAMVEKKIAEEKKNTELRARARWLLDQIGFWKQKIGTGEYEESIIHNNIIIYERELYGIPGYLWQ